jgi:hypothetical protein
MDRKESMGRMERVLWEINNVLKNGQFTLADLKTMEQVLEAALSATRKTIKRVSGEGQ